jgi:hypothetical protein
MDVDMVESESPVSQSQTGRQLTIHAGRLGELLLENPECTCRGFRPDRLDRGPPTEGCLHTTAAVDQSGCHRCQQLKNASNSGHHAAHHIGCPKSPFFRMTHEAIAASQEEKKEAKKASSKLKPADAKGMAPISSFFGGMRESVRAAPEPRSALSSGRLCASGSPEPPRAGSSTEVLEPGVGVVRRVESAAKAVCSAVAAVGAVFWPPSPVKNAGTSTGDGSVGDEAAATPPNSSLLEETEAEIVNRDEARAVKLMPELEAQIKYEISRAPNVKLSKDKEHYVVYKQGDQMTPEAYSERFPPGIFVIRNPESINTSDEVLPSLTQHALRGVNVNLARPELNRAKDTEVHKWLECTRDVDGSCCCGRLKFVRYSSSAENGKYKILLRGGERPGFSVDGSYKCTDCGATYRANEPEMRLKMSPSVRADLPVSLYHSVRDVNWWVDESFEALCEMDTVTYAGCDAIMRREWHTLQVKYNTHENVYLDHIRRYRARHPDDATSFREFPSFELWCGRPLPRGETLRKRLEAAHYAVGSGGDVMSRHEANVRYMQSVTTTPSIEGSDVNDLCFSSDHTFDAAKSFNVLGQNKVWNAATGWLLVLCAILVSTTSASEFLHAAECLAHRAGFKPEVHFTDTWPAEMGMWTALLPFTRGRLDVFHWMKRIIDTLRSSHENYKEATAALSRCVFQYNEDDEYAVKVALLDGSLNGKVHSEDEIEELKRTGVFKTRYLKYIASVTLAPATIQTKLQEWARTYPTMRDSTTDDTLGTRATDDALSNAYPHAYDIDDRAQHVQTLKPLPKQKHNLVEKKKVREGEGPCPLSSSSSSSSSKLVLPFLSSSNKLLLPFLSSKSKLLLPFLSSSNKLLLPFLSSSNKLLLPFLSSSNKLLLPFLSFLILFYFIFFM